MAALTCAPLPARAQTAASVTFLSDYVVRGMSLSRGQPVAQVRLDLDAGAWYAGALVSQVRYADSDANAQLLAYAGYARRLAAGLGWEAGALHSSSPGDRAYGYQEVYAGLAVDGLAGRVYLSPSYYGDAPTVYAELNGSAPLRGGLVLVGHLGLLQPLARADDEARRRVDVRVGFSFDSGAWNLRLALLANMPRRQGPQAPRALQLSASYGF